MESKEKLFIGNVYGVPKILSSIFTLLFNIYKMAHLTSLTSKEKTAPNY